MSTNDTKTKKRMKWTKELDDIFLEAIKNIENKIDRYGRKKRATPLSITKYMNKQLLSQFKPIITRKSVSSHLQYYRKSEVFNKNEYLGDVELEYIIPVFGGISMNFKSYFENPFPVSIQNNSCLIALE
jgi:SHAQKYF class myb-like DNA-binding protein